MASTYITDYLGRGTLALRPSTPNVASTALAIYYATDTDTVSKWNGTTWEDLVSTADFAGLDLTSLPTANPGSGQPWRGPDGNLHFGAATVPAGDVIGNAGTVAAVPIGTSVSDMLDRALGATQGDIVYRSGSAWTVLTPGTAGQSLRSGGAAANPSWVTGVTSVAGRTGAVTLTHTDLTDWAAATAGFSGTVTSVALSGGTTGLTASGSPIVASGTLTLSGTLAAANGGTGATALGSAFTNNAGTLTARQTTRFQAQWNSGATIVNDTFYFAYDAPYAGTLNSLTHFCSTGSFTVAVQINGVSVTGLGAVAPTATPTTTNATALNTFSAGQRISGVITGASGSPTDALLSLNVTWSN